MSPSNGTRVEDVMSTPLKTISKRATITDAATVMRDNGINALVVTTDPPSIITSTDIVSSAADGNDPTEVQVSEVMTKSVETVPPDLYLEEIAAMMVNFGIKHLPVVDEDDEYIGMISSTDITADIT